MQMERLCATLEFVLDNLILAHAGLFRQHKSKQKTAEPASPTVEFFLFSSKSHVVNGFLRFLLLHETEFLGNVFGNDEKYRNNKNPE